MNIIVSSSSASTNAVPSSLSSFVIVAVSVVPDFVYVPANIITSTTPAFTVAVNVPSAFVLMVRSNVSPSSVIVYVYVASEVVLEPESPLFPLLPEFPEFPLFPELPPVEPEDDDELLLPLWLLLLFELVVSSSAHETTPNVNEIPAAKRNRNRVSFYNSDVLWCNVV